MSGKQIRNIIGCARTIQTAVLVVAYLEKALGAPHSSIHPDRIRYELKEPTPMNGYWSADIFVEGDLPFDECAKFVDLCRAFCAGRGEIWR